MTHPNPMLALALAEGHRKAVPNTRTGTAADAYRLCAEGGLTQAQTARELGVTREAVRQMAFKHRIKFAPGKAVAQ